MTFKIFSKLKENRDAALILVVFAFLLFIRLYHLNSDMSPLLRTADITDEGYWTHNARNLFLFGRMFIDDLSQPFISAPLYSFLSFLSFKYLGVSFFSARLISALSGWLTLTMIFLLLRRTRPLGHSLFCVFILGFMNESLMYNRIALPESLQIMFMSLLFLFWALGSKYEWSHFAAGICLSLAFFAKMTAMYFAPVILVMWAFEWARKDLKIRNIALFVFGCFISLLPWFTWIYLPNTDKFSFFFQTVGKRGFGESYTFFRLLDGIINLPNIYLFGLPSLLIVLYVFIFYCSDLISQVIQNRSSYIKGLQFPEMMSIAWLIGGALPLATGIDHTVRRYIMFMIPLTILSTSVLFNSRAYSDNLARFITWIDPHLKSNRKMAWLITFLLLIPFVPLMDNYLTRAVILMPIFYLILLLLVRRLKPDLMTARSSLFFWTIFIFLPFIRLASVNMYDNALFINETLIPVIFFIGSALLFYANYEVFFRDKLEPVIKYAFAALIIFNLLINCAWLGHPSYSFLEGSKFIGKVSNKGDIVIGGYQHALSFENLTLPLWWISNPDYRSALDKINKDSPLRFKAKFILLPSELYQDEELAKRKAGPTLKDVRNILRKRPVFVKDLNLMPYLFTNKYWKTIKLFRLKDER